MDLRTARLPFELRIAFHEGPLVLLRRLVVDLDLHQDGSLRPRLGATWHVEPAQAEGGLHRRLAALADAPAQRIVGFASLHGYLRRSTPTPLDLPEPESRAITTAIGQQATDDAAGLREWLEAGASGPPPDGTAETLAETAVFASLPDWFLDATDLLLDGRVPAPPRGSVPDLLAVALPVAAATAPAAAAYLAQPVSVSATDRGRLLRAMRVVEWVSRVFASLEDAPADLAALGGPDTLIRTLLDMNPGAFDVPACQGTVGLPRRRTADLHLGGHVISIPTAS